MLIPRKNFEIVQSALNRQAAVALIGSRQVGKTTLALQVAEQRDSMYIDLETTDVAQTFEDPYWYLNQFQNQLVILDEIHRVPELFQVLRSVIDEGRRSGFGVGRFLILGSASVGLLKQSSESLAGRIEYIDIDPLSVLEVGAIEIDTLWLRGGYPQSFLEINERNSTVWRKNFVRTYVERDMSQFEAGLSTIRLDRLWTMLAHLHGTLLNVSNLARSLEASAPTISRYISFLESLLLVRRLMPYRANLRKRLVKAPKVYIRDSGILHTQLNLESFEELLRHPIQGLSWEGFVIEQVCDLVREAATPMFYRTAEGAEIDLLLEWHKTRELWAIEIKFTLATKVSRGFYTGIETLKTTRNFVVCADGTTQNISPKVECYKFVDFLEMLSEFV